MLQNFKDNFLEKELSSDWTMYKNTDELKIFYRQEAGKQNITLYLEKVIECPLINFAMILCEADLFTEWLPLVVKSRLLGRASYLRQIGEFEGWLPWPMSTRSAILQVCGFYDEQDNSNLLTLRSIHGNTWLNGITIERNPQTVYADINDSCMYIKQLGENRHILKIALNGDPKINFLP